MRTQDYTEAILSLAKEGKISAHTLTDLKKVLENRGHTRLYPKILAQLKRILEHDQKTGTALITLAKESDGSRYKNKIVEALTELKITEYTTSIDPTIVGGFIAEGSMKRVDASYKKQLLTLYRSLVS